MTVSNLKVSSAKDGSISLVWKLSDAVGARYYVYWANENNKSSFQKLVATTQNNYSVSNLDYNSTYYFAVTIYADNVESGFSEVVSAKPINVDAPSAPSSLFLYALNNKGNKSISLSWNENKEGDIFKYYVYRAENNEDSEYKKIAEIGANIFVDSSKIEVNEFYFYKVAAIDKAGFISPFSDSQKEYILDTSALISPKDDEVIYDKIVFKWKGLASAMGYRLVLCSSSTNTGFWMKDIPNSNAEEYEYVYDGEPLTYRKNYYWKICAFYKSWSSINSYSNTKSFYLTHAGDE